MARKRLRVYLAGPIVSGHDEELSNALVAHIQGSHVVTNSAIADPDSFDRDMTPTEIFNTARNALLSADAVIAEITRPSHGVGYELAVAANNEIPALCIYQASQEPKLSMMILGAPGMETAAYEDLPSAQGAIDRFLSKVATA
jgi:nucleoside 2-deoxyribosyltransferase